MSDLVLIGAGTRCKSIIAAAQQCGMNVVAIYDDDETLHGTTIDGVRVAGATASAHEAKLPAVLGFDDPARRLSAAKDSRLTWATIIHTNAFVHPTAVVGAGTIILEGVIAQPGVRIGRNVLIDANSTISHDSIVEDYAVLDPGVVLAGAAYIGKGARLATGAAVIPLVRVGAWSSVGPRAVVIRDLGDRSEAWGVPAMPVEVAARAAYEPWLKAQRILTLWVLVGAGMTGIGYLIARLGLFVRQYSAKNDIASHPLHLTLWIGIAFIALGIAVNLFVPFERWRMASRIGVSRAAAQEKISAATIVAIVLALLGVIMTAYLFDARHFPS